MQQRPPARPLQIALGHSHHIYFRTYNDSANQNSIWGFNNGDGYSCSLLSVTAARGPHVRGRVNEWRGQQADGSSGP